MEKGTPVFDVDIKLWDAMTAEVIAILNQEEKPTITGPVSNMYLHPECPEVLVACCLSGKLTFWDLQQKRLLRV